MRADGRRVVVGDRHRGRVLRGCDGAGADSVVSFTVRSRPAGLHVAVEICDLDRKGGARCVVVVEVVGVVLAAVVVPSARRDAWKGVRGHA